MISQALIFLKNRLNHYLAQGQDPIDSLEDKVIFPDGQNMEPLTFKLGAVSLLLINLEEENALRPADRYARTAIDGAKQTVQPEIHLNLYVLFVARFNQYEEALRYLSLIIRFFQSNRVFTAQNAPDLSQNIERLVLELVTLPFSEQNEVWNALRVTYHPSVLYKVKMLTFESDDVQESTEVSEQVRELSQ